jgi:aspartyl protease family protein
MAIPPKSIVIWQRKGDRQVRSNSVIWIVIGALGLTAMVLTLNNIYPSALASTDGKMRLLYSVGLLALVGGSFVVTLRHQSIGDTVRYALAWIAIGLVLVIGYSYRDVFSEMGDRVGAELSPTSARSVGVGQVEILATSAEMFGVGGKVNGARVDFLVDTGASTVALSRADAVRAGIDVTNLTYNVPFSTANGVVLKARVTLNSVSIGDIKLHNVAASVSQGELDQSLLGMSFLRRLSSFETRANKMILRQ